MTFIHGSVSWLGGESSGEHVNVDAMLDAVASYPWSGTEMLVSSGERSTCVLVVQAHVSGDVGAATAQHADAGLSVVADLRLDDRGRLARELCLHERAAAEAGEAELILLAYLRWGRACTDRVLGDGVFAVWDERAGRLFCSRDVTGVRPFYYWVASGERFVFSSDLLSLAAHPSVPTSIDLSYARGMLEFGGLYQHPSRTLCRDVFKLPAAHHLTVDASGLQVTPYWRPHRLSERVYANDADYVEELRELLRMAVACRVSEASQPVGSHLSGGLDSSSLAVLAQRELTQAGGVAGFSWAPPWDVVAEVAQDERLLAEAAAAFGRLTLHYTRLRRSDVVAGATRDLALQPTMTLRFEIATSRQAADSGVTTMLSGWGGDELVVFNGRGYFADLARRGRWLTLHRELRLRSDIHDGSLLRALRGRVVRPLLPGRLEQYLERGTPAVLPGDLHPEFARAVAGAPIMPRRDLREVPGVRRMQLMLLTNGHLQHRAESWAAHGATLGITYAYPLLDRRIVEFALSIPDDLYFRHGWKRWLYRTAMEGILPDEVRWHPHKQDLAMEAHWRQVGPGAAEELREQLRARRDNPFVDVDEALRRERQGLSSAAWMAFTCLRRS